MVANVLVPVVLSSPAMVKVLPKSKVSSAFERRKSAEVSPPNSEPTQTPLIAKHPLSMSIPAAKVEVAVLELCI